MSGVTLSSGVRSILLSLQNSAALTGAIQNRLATGKKINSALDNPSSYFTSLSLGNRAAGLNALLDAVGQAQQTLQAANHGLDALSKMVQTAKSVALQARRSPLPQTTYSQIDLTGSGDVSGETIGSVTGSVDTSGGFQADVDGLQIKVGASTFTVHQASSPATENIGAIIADINNTPGLGPNGAVKAALDASGKFLKLTAGSSDVSFDVLSSAAASALGVDGQAGASTNLLQAVPGLTGTGLTVQVNGGATKTVTFGNSGAQVSTFAELQNALASVGVIASVSGQNPTLSVAASSTIANSLTTSGSALGALGLPGGTVFGTVNAPTPNAARASYQAQYNDLLQQIDRLAQDSSYNGINLLGGDSLSAAFNETGSSSLTIAGAAINAAALNLVAMSGDDFQSNAVIDNAVTGLDGALVTLRAQAATFGSTLNTLQARQEFTRSLINTLQTGADNLVLADTNEEGANLLALQTRQGLSLTALSLSAQSDQAVLKLFH